MIKIHPFIENSVIRFIIGIGMNFQPFFGEQKMKKPTLGL
jgi:hypothetical protein